MAPSDALSPPSTARSRPKIHNGPPSVERLTMPRGLEQAHQCPFMQHSRLVMPSVQVSAEPEYEVSIARRGISSKCKRLQLGQLFASPVSNRSRKATAGLAALSARCLTAPNQRRTAYTVEFRLRPPLAHRRAAGELLASGVPPLLLGQRRVPDPAHATRETPQRPPGLATKLEAIGAQQRH